MWKTSERNQDYYYSPIREIDLTILMDKLWWDITHSGSQTLSDLTEEQYPEFQDGYKSLTEQEASTKDEVVIKLYKLQYL